MVRRDAILVPTRDSSCYWWPVPISGPHNELQSLLDAADEPLPDVPSAAAMLARAKREAIAHAASQLATRPIDATVAMHPQLRAQVQPLQCRSDAELKTTEPKE